MKVRSRGKRSGSEREILEQNRGFVEHWRRVGPLLEEISLREHAAMTATVRRRAIAAVMALARRPTPLRTTSGLVEYYRKLEKLRK